jgi:hypothetical protein
MMKVATSTIDSAKAPRFSVLFYSYFCEHSVIVMQVAVKDVMDPHVTIVVPRASRLRVG